MRKEITALSTLRSLPYSKQELAPQSSKQLSVGKQKVFAPPFADGGASVDLPVVSQSVA
jgi:hypothetical protein